MNDSSRLPLTALLAMTSVAVTSLSCSPGSGAETDYMRWAHYEGDAGATHYSAIDQIDRSNVDRLQVAWTYESPGVADVNPIVIDSMLYAIGEAGSIIALHAATGEELWKHESDVSGAVRMHGLMYWESSDRSDRRVLFQKGSYHLLAIDAMTGQPVASFGEGGKVDLRQGLDIDPSRVTRATSPAPGKVFENLVILGAATGEGYVAAPGHIRAFDVRTGKQAWIFHTLPQPGEYGYDTWPEGRTENAGGANAWGGMSLDEERGIVFIPLGSANYDFYGVDRHGENLFANSLVALNARTGERIWHFQTVHHDLWDYDLTATPTLLTVRQNGRPVDIVVQATKTGLIFAFNRETGESLWPIEERPVPASDMPGEQAWPTQPYPTRPDPFIPLVMDIEKDLNPHMSPEDRDSLTTMLRGMLYKGIFTPPSTQPTIQVPGNRGGANWGSTAGDPRDGTFYVLSYNMPSVLHLLPIIPGRTGTGSSPYDQGHNVYIENCEVCHGSNLQGNPASGIAPLTGVVGRLTEVELEEVIRSGRGLMPPWPQLTPQQYDALALFLSNPQLALTMGQTVSTGEVPGTEPERYQSGWVHILDSKGVPVIRPPWFRLTAYDMNEGTIKWQVPVGEVDHLAEQGITGTGSAIFVRGGPALTAGDLIFLSTDDIFRAYDRETGAELWSTPLPGAGEGVPAIYEVNGRQFVFVAATAGRRWGQQPQVTAPRNPSYIAFALPEGEPGL
jgi:quinoprotein glucose dehydrogenase